MFVRAFVIIALVCAIPSALCYSAGAPSAACQDMVPQHHVEPQSSKAPYKFLLNDGNQYKAGQSVNLKLKGDGSGDLIKGFMIQAHIDGQPVGKFDIPPNSKKYAQLLNCGVEGNALTHKKIFGAGQNSIDIVWIPPSGVTGKVTFFATIALNGGIYWVKRPLAEITLS